MLFELFLYQCTTTMIQLSMVWDFYLYLDTIRSKSCTIDLMLGVFPVQKIQRICTKISKLWPNLAIFVYVAPPNDIVHSLHTVKKALSSSRNTVKPHQKTLINGNNIVLTVTMPQPDVHLQHQVWQTNKTARQTKTGLFCLVVWYWITKLCMQIEYIQIENGSTIFAQLQNFSRSNK